MSLRDITLLRGKMLAVRTRAIRLVALLGLGLLVVPALPVTPAGAAAPAPATFRGATYPGVSVPPSADKPQSKLWQNDGSWWAIMLAPNGGIHVFELVNHAWRDTGAVVDTRNTSTGDALWDGSKLYVASRTAGGALFVNRLSYGAGSRTYTVDGGFPVQVASNGMESATIAKDTAGVLWVTFTQASQVWIAHSTTAENAWTAPARPPVSDTSVSADDISSVIAWNGKVGVFWSNQRSAADRFAVHVDGAPDTQWTLETALSGPRMADDHIELRASPSDPQGRLFALVKTSKGDCSCDLKSDPLVVLLVRSANGTWTSTNFGTVAEDHTRPQLQIDDTNHRLIAMATAPVVGGTVYYKVTSMDSPSFAAGRGTPFVAFSGATINNASTSKQPVTSSSGLVALATDSSRYFHTELAIEGAGGTVLDTTPPSSPQGLAASPVTSRRVDLSWQAATDNVGVTGYTVFRNGVAVATPGATTFSDTTVSPSTTYTYSVDAFDAAGNHSPQSGPVAVTTPADAPPPPPPPPPPPSGSGIALRGASYAANPTATTLTIALPAGTQAGDVMLAVVADRGQPNVTAPSGWSGVRKDQNSSTMGQWIFVKVATASEPSSFTFTLSSSQAAAGGILAYSGVNQSSPIDTSGGQSNASGTAVTAPSITTSTPNAMLVGFFGIASSATVAPPGGMTERGEQASTAGSFKVDSEAADALLSASGATGTRSATASAGAASIGQLVALRPA